MGVVLDGQGVFDSVPERLREWGIPFEVLNPREITGDNGMSMVGLVEGYPDLISTLRGGWS